MIDPISSVLISNAYRDNDEYTKYMEWLHETIYACCNINHSNVKIKWLHKKGNLIRVKASWRYEK